jgi:Domain of unknown function (DUF5615)
MLRLLADENFNGDIIRGVLLRRPEVDLVRVQDVGLSGSPDEDVLAWSAGNDRIILTHDRATMPDLAYDRLAEGDAMPGVFVFNDRFPIGQAIDEILLLDECSEGPEWTGRVVHLPL